MRWTKKAVAIYGPAASQRFYFKASARISTSVSIDEMMDKYPEQMEDILSNVQKLSDTERKIALAQLAAKVAQESVDEAMASEDVRSECDVKHDGFTAEDVVSDNVKVYDVSEAYNESKSEEEELKQ